MKVNELVWKKMSLCESESESSFVDQVGQTWSGECKANNLNSASSRYFECTVFTILHHRIEHALVRVFGLATSAGTTSSCTRRWRSSSSTPTLITIFRKSTWKMKCFKDAERREPDFQQQGGPSHIFLIFTTSNPDFLAQRTCSTWGSILKNTRRRWSSSWNAQWALSRRKKR